MFPDKRIYNPTLASDLEDLLNKPYNTEEGSECSTCKEVEPTNYELTGYVTDDGRGVYVEKRCKCGTVTEEGDGDFYEAYRFDIEGDIIRMEDEA